MCTDHVNSTPILSTTVYIMSFLFFSFFPDVLAIFMLITTLGNVHRPYKQYPNIVTNSLHHVFSFFPDFLTIFTSITILGNAHRPGKQLSNITTPSLFFFLIFSYCFHLKLQNLPYLAIFSVHSCHWIPVPFRSGQFRGLFR